MLRTFALLAAALLAAAPGSGQTRPAAGGVIDGFVTTQAKTIPLGGAQVVVRNAVTDVVATVLSEGDGHFHVVAVPDGRYRITATLAGFEVTDVPALVTAGTTVDVSIDMPIAAISQTVEVVGSAEIARATTIARTDTLAGRDIEQYASGGFQATLRLLASIIEVPGGVSIKGGRPSQAGLQIGSGTLVDPSTGLSLMSLPDDAIDSVAVLPNPYAVEYGRFSSGLVVIQTRRAGDQWKTRLNNLDPTFRTARGTMFDIKGVGAFAPRLETGGPIVKERLFVEQAAQFRYGTTDVASRSEDELKTTRWFSSFTRVDANASPRHSLVATAGFFPSVETQATLGTFTPPDATADVHARVNHGGVTERALWSDSFLSETTLQVHQARTDVVPQGQLAMTLLPDTTLGNFYNTQHRSTATYQIVEAVSGTRNAGGLHLFKAGFDLLYSQYEGTSASRPVLIDRADGTLARRLDFTGPSAQAVDTTDVALFVQDRYQPTTRWYLEFGGRVDRDGIVERFNVTPRIGTAILLDDAGRSTIRGGYGLFYERTPSTAGAFRQFESALDTRYAADGTTLAAPPTLFVHTAGALETPRSRTWDVGIEHRLNERWTVRGGIIDRSGDHDLIVEPIRTGTGGALALSSGGRSRYREAEAGIRFTHGPAAEANVSYVHSTARGDLNSLSSYYDAVMWPIVGQNAYAPSYGDVPHRLLARGRVMPSPTWLLLGILDWRSGMPWSAVNEYLDFVGPRNETYRFPAYARTEIGVEHRFRIFGLKPWIGIRAYNAFDAFLPADVQANLNSPLFGTFYNSEYRQFRLQFRFER